MNGSRMILFIFVLRKKGSETKERMKEEEIEKGDCGPPTRKVFFFEILSDLNEAVVRWCIRLTHLTLVCELIRYRLVQVRQNLKKNDTVCWRSLIV